MTLKKSIITIVLFCSFLMNAEAQDTLFYENFQSNSLGQFIGIDLDGLELGDDFVGLDGSFQTLAISGPNDFRAIGISSFAETGMANNWLISDPVLISKENTILSWEAASLRGDDDRLESYRVLISTTANTIASFTDELLFVSQESVEIQKRQVDLSAYIGKNVFIGFNQIGTDNYALTLDNILITEPENENSADLLSIIGNRYQEVDDKSFAFEITNNGSVTIENLKIELSLNGVISELSFDNLSIAPSDSRLIPFADLITIAPIKYAMTASVLEVNGVAFNSSRTIDKDFYMIEGGPRQKLVIEDAQGTSCGWCPRVRVQKEIMEIIYSDDVISISVHNDDPMANIVYDVGLRNLDGFVGFPSAVMNRKGFVLAEDMDAYYQTNIGNVAPLSINIEHQYNPLTRELTVETSSTAFTTLESSVHRYALVIKEDGVSGEEADFDQLNFFSFQSSDIPLIDINGLNWQDLANPVPAQEIVYNNVARDIVTGFDGIFDSVADAQHSDAIGFEINYNLPSTFNEDNIYLVVLALDVETGEIVNAAEKKMDFQSASNEPDSEFEVHLYPNPSLNKSVLAVTLDNPKELFFSLFDNLGNKIMSKSIFGNSGLNEISIDKNELPSGIYNCQIIIDNEVVTKKLIFL